MSDHSLSKIAFIGLILSLASAIAAMASGFGSHFGLWHFRTGFKILRIAAACAGVSSIIALIALISGLRKRLWRDIIISFIGLSIGLAAFGFPFSMYLASKRLPRIHDITTDTENPPGFFAVIPLRKNAPNSSDYGGPDITAKQRQGYPDIKTLFLDIPPDRAFEKALAAARNASWDIVDANRNELRIEATATTFWYGFKDDIVIRIMPVDNKSRVDIRSVSRVGVSDVGANAERIRKYLRELSKD